MAVVAVVALEAEPVAVLLVEDQVAVLLVESVVQAVPEPETVELEPVVMAHKVERDRVGQVMVHKVDWVVQATAHTATATTDTMSTSTTTIATTR